MYTRQAESHAHNHRSSSPEILIYLKHPGAVLIDDAGGHGFSTRFEKCVPRTCCRRMFLFMLARAMFCAGPCTFTAYVWSLGSGHVVHRTRLWSHGPTMCVRFTAGGAVAAYRAPFIRLEHDFTGGVYSIGVGRTCVSFFQTELISTKIEQK